MVLLAGGQPVIVPCGEADGFKLTAPSRSHGSAGSAGS
jgi:hypothetical protein